MPPLSIENLPFDLNILPLLIVKKTGMPKGKADSKGGSQEEANKMH
jgi:hypothetical protein